MKKPTKNEVWDALTKDYANEPSVIEQIFKDARMKSLQAVLQEEIDRRIIAAIKEEIEDEFSLKKKKFKFYHDRKIGKYNK